MEIKRIILSIGIGSGLGSIIGWIILFVILFFYDHVNIIEPNIIIRYFELILLIIGLVFIIYSIKIVGENTNF